MNHVGWMAVALVLGAVGGVAGGLEAVRLRVPDVAAKAVSAAATQESGDLDDIDARVVALEETVRALERERRLAQMAASLAKTKAGETAPAKAAAPDSRSAVDDPVFEQAVRSVLESVEAERLTEREAERERRSREFSARWIEDIAQPLRLTDTQKSRLAQLTAEYSQTRRSLGRSNGAAGSVDREQRAQQMALLKERYEQRLGELLDRQQMESFRSLDARQQYGFGR